MSDAAPNPHAAKKYTRPPVAKPYPARTELLPSKLDDVTPAWLTRVLQNRYPGIVVNGLNVNQLIGGHTTKVRVSLDLNEIGKAAGIPEKVCLKSNWSGSFHDVDICALEAQFYYFLQPLMKGKTPIADCYYADWDEERDDRAEAAEGVVMLEDLTERGGKFGHSTHAAGIDGVAKAYEDLALMHGSMWGNPILHDMKWLPYNMQTPIDNDQIRIMQKWIDMNLDDAEFRKILPQHYLDNPGKLQDAYDAVIHIENSWKGPICVNLGDCHQGNTYIMPNGHRMCVDWQLVRKGTPWRDITYFMLGALTIDERRKAERDLLVHYRQALVATGAEGVPSQDEIWELYRRWVIYGIQAWVANRDEWGNPGLEMNRRVFTAGEDLDTWKLLLG